MNATISSSKIQVLKELEQALGSPLDTLSQVPPSKPLVIVINGPSGVGKDAVIKRLQEIRSEIHFVRYRNHIQGLQQLESFLGKRQSSFLWWLRANLLWLNDLWNGDPKASRIYWSE